MPLRIDTTIPFANACGLELLEDRPVPEVRFAADPHGGPEALWFCLRVVRDAKSAARQMKLVLKHPGNMLGVGTLDHLRPVVRTAETDWQRLGLPEAETLPDGRRLATWTVDVPAEWLETAFCYPYGRPKLERLVQECDGHWRADAIGASQGGRPIVRLSSGPGAEGSDRPGLYLVARQHSGETPGSWVLDGLLRRMAEQHRRTPLVWAVPLANIDGVESGDYGKDHFPWDLNRAWGTGPAAQPMRHEVLVMQRDVARWRTRCRPVLALDLHAPGGCEASGAYFFVPDPETEPDAHAEAARWAGILAEALGRLAAADHARVARYPSRFDGPSFRQFFRGVGVPGLCMETPYALAGETVLTRKVYREIGVRLADRLADAASP